MKKIVLAALIIAALALPAIASAGGGFDQYGYNNTARLFVGAADGVDRVLDGAVWGDPTYAKDHLVMKWNAEWDRGNDEGWTDSSYNAWEDNEWDGNCDGCSGEVWHYKIVWVGNCGAEGAELANGGYCIWGQFETIMDHGRYPSQDPGQTWFAHAKATGYGSFFAH